MPNQKTVLFNHIPNLNTTREAFGINSFRIKNYEQPTYTVSRAYNAVVTLQSTSSFCSLSLTYEDAFLLGLHLLKVGATNKSAHEVMHEISQFFYEDSGS